MGYYIGLDVSQKQTWICVVDDKGKTVASSLLLATPLFLLEPYDAAGCAQTQKPIRPRRDH